MRICDVQLYLTYTETSRVTTIRADADIRGAINWGKQVTEPCDQRDGVIGRGKQTNEEADRTVRR